MNLRDLHYFVAAIEEGSFTRAARRCFVAQQALSIAIARLERDVGQQLFERDHRGAVPTEAGTRLLPRARELLRLADEPLEESLTADSQPARLGIGLMVPAAAEITSPILRAYRKAHPDVAVSIHELGFEHLLPALMARTVDVALTVGPVADERLKAVPLFVEPQAAILPRRHRLADANELQAETLLDEVFVSGAESPPAWIAHWRLEQMRNGEPPRVADRVASDARTPAEVNEVVAGGVAIVTGPMSHARACPHPEVVCVPVLDAPGSQVSAAARVAADARVEEFIEVAQRVTRKLIRLVDGARLGDPLKPVA
jgi:DNA-binding transcriptional LysR family regulator